MSGGESYNTQSKPYIDPTYLDWFINKGSEDGSPYVGADKLKNLMLATNKKTGAQNYYSASDPGDNLNDLVSAYDNFIKKKATERSDYLNLKSNNPGRDATILVPGETKDPSTILGQSNKNTTVLGM